MNMTRILGVLLAVVITSVLTLVTTPPAIAGIADISKEKTFRTDPVGATSSIVKKVFGAMR